MCAGVRASGIRGCSGMLGEFAILDVSHHTPVCGVRITGTNTAPAYTNTMTFSMVPVTKAYSLTDEPPPSNLRPTTAPLDPNRTDPGRADAPGATRLPPLPSPSAATPRENEFPPSPSPKSKRARARARASTQLAQITPHAAAVAEQDWPTRPTHQRGGGEGGGSAVVEVLFALQRLPCCLLL